MSTPIRRGSAQRVVGVVKSLGKRVNLKYPDAKPTDDKRPTIPYADIVHTSGVVGDSKGLPNKYYSSKRAKPFPTSIMRGVPDKFEKV